MKNCISLLAAMLLFAAISYSQGRRITGQVKDDKGQPVAFATITETNTTNAAVADAAGNFTITINGNQLTITGAGFQSQTITVTGTTANITLVTAGQLQEVVVTSLGIRRSRNQVPYAAQQISGEEVSKKTGETILFQIYQVKYQVLISNKQIHLVDQPMW